MVADEAGGGPQGEGGVETAAGEATVDEGEPGAGLETSLIGPRSHQG